MTRTRVRGIGDATDRLTTVVSRWISSRGQLLVYGIDPATAAVPEVVPASFRQATAGDARRYVRDVGTDSVTTFVRRLNGPHRCFIVEMNDRIVHSSWFATGSAWVGEMAAYLVLPPRHGYVYESFTHPSVRGRGLYPFALTQMCRVAAEDGSPKVWVAIEEDNLPSRRAVEKAGFQVTYSIGFERRLGSVRHDMTGEREEVVPRISPQPA